MYKYTNSIQEALETLRLLLSAILFLPIMYLGTAFGETNDVTISKLKVMTYDDKICDVCGVAPAKYIVFNVTNNNDTEEPIVAIVDVRDASGVTVFLEFIIGTLNSGQTSEMGISWAINEPGQYMIRSFAVTNFTKPEILSLPVKAQVTIS